MMNHYSKLDKLSVAERQLNESIRLFFEGRDPVSVHTLAAATLQVLTDYGQAHGVMGYSRNKNFYQPEKFRGAMAAIKQHENFFKHADHDADAVIDFNPEITRMFQIEACDLHLRLRGKRSWETVLYYLWFGVTYPAAVTESANQFLIAMPEDARREIRSFAFARKLLNPDYMATSPLYRAMAPTLTTPQP